MTFEKHIQYHNHILGLEKYIFYKWEFLKVKFGKILPDSKVILKWGMT